MFFLSCNFCGQVVQLFTLLFASINKRLCRWTKSSRSKAKNKASIYSWENIMREKIVLSKSWYRRKNTPSRFHREPPIHKIIQPEWGKNVIITHFVMMLWMWWNKQLLLYYAIILYLEEWIKNNIWSLFSLAWNIIDFACNRSHHHMHELLLCYKLILNFLPKIYMIFFLLK